MLREIGKKWHNSTWPIASIIIERFPKLESLVIKGATIKDAGFTLVLQADECLGGTGSIMRLM